MTQNVTQTGAIASMLRKHRREALDLTMLAVALVLTERAVAQVPLGVAICAVACATLIPLRNLTGPPTPWSEFKAALPRRIAAVLSAGVLLHYFLVRPLDCLWFAAIWPVAAWLAAIDWKWVAGRFSANRRFMSPLCQESLRLAVLAVGTLCLMKGFARATLHGAADAQWYSLNMADAVTQAREGVFPIWVGQSIYQFNGSIAPIRVAPAFQYLGVLLDALTFRTLGIFALQNFLIILLALGATGTAYLGLRRLLPGREWLAAGLALLFFSCPGVVGIPYNGDLFMSWTTLPLIPVLCFSIVQSFRNRGDASSMAGIGGALGLCWWGHAPIALWSTFIAGASQIVRIALQARRGVALMPLLVGGALFACLAAYPIGSVLRYPAEPSYHAEQFQNAPSKSVVEALGPTFPDSFLPVSVIGRSPGDFQLGYALWAVLLLALWSQRRSWTASSSVLLSCAAVMAVMLIPVPGLAVAIWSAVPAFARDATGSWPATRFCVLMAGATVFGAAACVAAGLMDEAKRRNQFAVLIAVGCVWSFAEALRFDANSAGHVQPKDSAVDLFRPENIQLTRYSYGFFPHYPALPTTFTHGVTDPELENHLLTADFSSTISRGYDVALSTGRPLASSGFSWLPAGHPDHAELDQKLRIEPNKSYLLNFAFDHPDTIHGVLQISGRHFFREYGVPEHGGPKSFGVGGQHLTAIPVQTTSGPEDLEIRYFPSEPLPADLPAPPLLGDVQLLGFDRSSLPVRMDGWIPYRATVRSPADGWLETPRAFQSGYVATVNGQPAEVKESPEALVSVAVPRGDSAVQLEYRPPAGLRPLFWLSFLSAVAVLLVGAAKFILNLLGKPYPAKTSNAA